MLLPLPSKVLLLLPPLLLLDAAVVEPAEVVVEEKATAPRPRAISSAMAPDWELPPTEVTSMRPKPLTTCMRRASRVEESRAMGECTQAVM